MALKIVAFSLADRAASVHDRAARVSAKPQDGSPDHIDPAKKLQVTFDLVLDKPIYQQGRLDEVIYILDNAVISEAPPTPPAAAVPAVVEPPETPAPALAIEAPAPAVAEAPAA